MQCSTETPTLHTAQLPTPFVRLSAWLYGFLPTLLNQAELQQVMIAVLVVGSFPLLNLEWTEEGMHMNCVRIPALVRNKPADLLPQCGFGLRHTSIPQRQGLFWQNWIPKFMGGRAVAVEKRLYALEAGRRHLAGDLDLTS